MIPQNFITDWRNTAPWFLDSQVEQDLILSRALVEIFQDGTVSNSLVLRGGTALHKLYMDEPLRYSEDIDLVQHTEGPIGPILDGLRARLDPFLGKPRRERNPGTVTLLYRMETESIPVKPLKLKVEINSREHFDVFGVIEKKFEVKSPWFNGQANIKTYTLEELLGTKLRALYQRRKGRDLFDQWVGLEKKSTQPAKIVEAFKHYMKEGKTEVTQKEFKRNLEEKMSLDLFHGDLKGLLKPTVEYDPVIASQIVTKRLLDLI